MSDSTLELSLSVPESHQEADHCGIKGWHLPVGNHEGKELRAWLFSGQVAFSHLLWTLQLAKTGNVRGGTGQNLVSKGHRIPAFQGSTLVYATSASFPPQRGHERRTGESHTGHGELWGNHTAKMVARGCPERLWMPIHWNVQGQMGP